MRSIKQLFAGLAVAVAVAFGGLADADIVYIGDAADEGQMVVEGTNAFSVDILTIVNLSDGFSGAPVIYTSATDQDVTLTEVNFFTESAGNLTPFVARILGAGLDGSFNGQTASSYEVLAIGDSVTGGAGTLVNGAFTVGGNNPIINLSAGDRIAAGFLTDVARLISNNAGTPQGVTDYIFSGDSISGATIGGPLTANSTFGQFDRSLSFNVGFETAAVPEPSSAILLVGMGLPLMLRRRRA